MSLAAAAAKAASPYTGPVVWFCLVAGAVLLLVGLFAVVTSDLPAEKAARDAAKATSQKAKAVADDPGKAGGEAQGAIKDTLAGLSEFAKALKDLTTATRVLLIGVLLVLVAAIGAGADAIGDDGSSSTTTTTTTTSGG